MSSSLRSSCTAESSTGMETISAPGTLDLRAQIYGEIGTKAKTEVVVLVREAPQRRLLELDEHFGRGHGQAFAGADQERNAVPAPGIDFETHSGKGLHFGIGRDVANLSITFKLAAHHVCRLKGRNGAKDAHLLVAQRFGVHAGGRLHR